MAGGFGAVIGTPAEVALIRMTSDGRLPPEQRRGYKNVFDALLRICREEGVLAMWRGCTLDPSLVTRTCTTAHAHAPPHTRAHDAKYQRFLCGLAQARQRWRGR
jgi:hypothetical protein